MLEEYGYSFVPVRQARNINQISTSTETQQLSLVLPTVNIQVVETGNKSVP